MTTLVWFRHDLRLEDNPALHEAAKRGPVVPVFIWAPSEEGDWRPGGASAVWLHHSLSQLQSALGKRTSRLIVQEGDSYDVLIELTQKCGANAVFWNRRYEPLITKRDARIEKQLKKAGIEVQTFNSALLHEPWDLLNKQGQCYRVFTPFWKAMMRQSPPPPPLPAPDTLPGTEKYPDSVSLANLNLLPLVDWASGIREAWQPGEAGAHAQLERFIQDALASYGDNRDFPRMESVSRLSPHLRFGEIGPRQIWNAIYEAGETINSSAYLRQLVWREFSYHLLYHFPHTSSEPLRPEFSKFPWRKDPDALHAWQEGKTGYPLIDAGMRELWRTGWMHNRIRMAVASFLVKDLLLPWQDGARWFWDTLVDADLANNTMGWQWIAGCGADAAPYFRIFNPVTQGERFDPEGDYVRQWVPELENLPNQWIHKPWKAPAAVMHEAGVELGNHYPLPIVDHAQARARALEALEHIKKG